MSEQSRLVLENAAEIAMLRSKEGLPRPVPVDQKMQVDRQFEQLAEDQYVARNDVDAEIRLFGQPVLRKASLDVEEIDAPLVGLCHRLVLAMRRSGGLGVAAPQLGTLRRLFVFGDGIVAINPVLVESDGEQTGPESCLSMPGVTVQMKRAQRVLMHAVDIDGKGYEYEAEDLQARLFQHEVDHLDGVLMIDRLPTRQQKRDAERRLAKAGLSDRSVG